MKIPRVRYPTGGAGTVWALTLPFARAWTPGRRIVGGQGESSAGIPETYVIARHRVLALELRLLETELVQLEAFLDWWEDNAVAWDLDVGDGVWRPVYLERPAVGEETLEYQRDANYRQAFVVPIVVRTSDGAPIRPEFF